MSEKPVRVQGAPGYEEFDGWEYERFESVDHRGELSIIVDSQGDILIIPSEHVTYVTLP